MTRARYSLAATALLGAIFCALGWSTQHAAQAAAARARNALDGSATPTFYRDVLPILEAHCQECHRAGGIAPMALETYEQTRNFATAIRTATSDKTMPPWFADPTVGKFSNDPSLSAEQIARLAAWAASGAPAGDR